MSNYAILRTKKLTTIGKVGAACAHNSRSMPVPNADPNRSHLNRRAVGSGDLVADVQSHIEATGAKLAKNSPPAFELILTASPDAMKRLQNGKELAAWARENLAFLRDEYGDNLLALDIHMDERTPHIHAVVCPVVAKYDKRCKREVARVTCKHYLGGREKLQALQDRYADRMQQFDLERGQKRSRARHSTLKEWYSVVSKYVGKIAPVLKQNTELKDTLRAERADKERAQAQLKTVVAAQKKSEQAHDTNPFKNAISESLEL